MAQHEIRLHRPTAQRTIMGRDYSFAKVGFIFFKVEESAALTSSVCRLAEFQIAVYLRSRQPSLARVIARKNSKEMPTYSRPPSDP